MTNMTFTSYLRVSTDKQGAFGLGIEAQRAAVMGFVDGRDGILLTEFVEVESGAKNDRTQLAAAFAYAKKSKSVLLIAKLDRLSRNVAFISALIESGVEFIAVDNPHANKMMLQMMAVFAEHERDMISRRVKDALAAAKARGVKLGGLRGAKPFGGKNGAATNKAKASAYAVKMLPLLTSIKSTGLSLRDVAAHLNATGVETMNGGKWFPTTVKNILDRAAA